MRHQFLATITMLVVASSAHAGSLALFTENMPATVIAGHTTNILAVNFTDTAPTPALRGQQLVVRLDAGAIYRDENGSKPPSVPIPPPQNFCDLFCELPDDSFITMGGLRAGTSMGVLGVGCAANLPGGCDAPIPSYGKFDEEGISYAWAPGTGVNPPPGNGFITAQITLSNDANGRFWYFGSTADGFERIYSALPIRGGVMIPEPATAVLAAFAWAGVLGLTRRTHLPRVRCPSWRTRGKPGRSRLTTDCADITDRMTAFSTR